MLMKFENYNCSHATLNDDMNNMNKNWSEEYIILNLNTFISSSLGYYLTLKWDMGLFCH